MTSMTCECWRPSSSNLPTAPVSGVDQSVCAVAAHATAHSNVSTTANFIDLRTCSLQGPRKILTQVILGTECEPYGMCLSALRSEPNGFPENREKGLKWIREEKANIERECCTRTYFPCGRTFEVLPFGRKGAKDQDVRDESFRTQEEARHPTRTTITLNAPRLRMPCHIKQGAYKTKRQDGWRTLWGLVFQRVRV